MKLRNKKTGEILGSLGSFIIQNPNGINCEAITKYNSLAELNEDWEDYEEPKLFKSIGTIGSSVHIEMGSAEEAKKAVEKLKAWQRLKDEGFRFEGWNVKTASSNGDHLIINLHIKDCTGCEELLDLLFGGEE